LEKGCNSAGYKPWSGFTETWHAHLLFIGITDPTDTNFH